jgi:hypothetical protein
LKKQSNTCEKNSAEVETLPFILKFHLTIIRFDQFVEQQRVFLLDDPSLPSCVRGNVADSLNSLVPHFRDEVSLSSDLDVFVYIFVCIGVFSSLPPLNGCVFVTGC